MEGLRGSMRYGLSGFALLRYLSLHRGLVASIWHCWRCAVLLQSLGSLAENGREWQRTEERLRVSCWTLLIQS